MLLYKATGHPSLIWGMIWACGFEWTSFYANSSHNPVPDDVRVT